VDQTLEALTLKLNGGSTLDRDIPGGVAVALPFCLKIEQEVPVVVQRGDTVEGLLLQHYGLAGQITLRETYELNNQDRRWKSQEAFSRSLEPGKSILLPYTSEERVFAQADTILAPGTATTAVAPGLIEILEHTTSPAAAAAVFANMVSAPKPPKRGAQEFDYVQFVTANDAGGKHGCVEAPGDPPPFDVALLKTRFAVEMLAAGKYVPNLTPALVGVIDSGISGVDTGVFAARFLHANPKELNGTLGDDDDLPKNGFIDDVYGMNFNGGPAGGSVVYYGADPDGEHGTKVGTLVLGGQDWVQAWDSKAAPWAQLTIINYSDSTAPHPVDAIHLANAIDYLLAEDARVVNMSLSNRQPLEPVRAAIRGSRRALFVVAAGNTAAGGQDIAINTVYPASDGGESGHLWPVVLTVGAHNRDKTWSGFSNYSKKFVDLLAPGCAVPTLDTQGKATKENGTSIATAITSFAAGLIGALGETDARNLKIRLLISVDVDTDLEDRVRSSGRLNIVKAVSLSNDVVEQIGGGQTYLFGRLADRNELRRFCGDPVKQLSLGAMRKVRPHVAGSQGPRIHYWVENDGILATVDCPETEADKSIGLLVTDGQSVAGPPLAEVRDIVLADR
jgi:hypothetical protein